MQESNPKLTQSLKEKNRVDFVFDLEPTPKGRPRVSRFGGVYTPGKTRLFENAVKMMAKAQYRGEPLACPVHLSVFFVMTRPKSVKRSHHTTKPDLTNLIKSLEDALNGVVWKDDSQIFSVSAVKRYGPKGQINVTVTGVESD